jgi:peptidoglycan hydrolase CwlO-like protein
MDTQSLINILFTIAGAMGGWILNNLKSSIETLQKADTNLSDKVQHIEVLVAGTYVKRDDLEKINAAMFLKLDKLTDKIDKLMERP